MRTELSVPRLFALVGLLAIASPIVNLAAAAEPAAAPTAQGGGSKTAAEPQAAGPRVDPRAEQIVRRACAELADAKTFTFHAEVTFEQVLPQSPVKIQFAGATDYWVRKPDALAVDFESDLGAKRFWYDGTTLTVFDAPKMMYTSTAVPASIDAMMERVAETNHLTLPLADLAMSDPCVNFKRVIFGAYVGRGDVGGVACDHLAFTESNFDWQIWIQHAGKPLPRKVVINYRSTPGAPEYVAVISDWKFPTAIPDSRFTPQIPNKAIRIKFVDLKEPHP
ncbi:MAG TPA: DUF2092 domain-containing protein [Candidatus Binataceae bacterium]|nr:DUF2092 domain-containing protein [Candidatus Binataceae bacterium]